LDADAVAVFDGLGADQSFVRDRDQSAARLGRRDLDSHASFFFCAAKLQGSERAAAAMRAPSLADQKPSAARRPFRDALAQRAVRCRTKSDAAQFDDDPRRRDPPDHADQNRRHGRNEIQDHQ